MNKKRYGITGIILIVIISTVLISGCIGSGENSSSSSKSEKNNSSSSTNQNIDYIFNNFDLNNDGKISFSELQAWASVAGYDSLDVNSLRILFNMFDSDGNGYLDRNELNEFLKNQS